MFRLIADSLPSPVRDFLIRWRLYYPRPWRLNEIAGDTSMSMEQRVSETNWIMQNLRIDGFHKKTGAGRLDRLNAWVLPHLRNLPGDRIRLLDVGASDGTTTVEAINELQEATRKTVSATILDPFIRLKVWRRAGIWYYMTPEYTPHLLHWGPFGIYLEYMPTLEGKFFNPVVCILRTLLLRTRITAIMSKQADVLLVSPISRKHPRIEWIEEGVLASGFLSQQSYDVIRCANILNLGYFSEQDISQAVTFLIDSMKNGGYLLVSRSVRIGEDERDDASLWVKRDGKLHHVDDLNQGSEICRLMPT